MADAALVEGRGLPDGSARGSGRQAGVVCSYGRARQAVAARRRLASLRSANTAAAAAARAAAAAIRAICQPAMPPVLITWTVAGGTGVMGTAPPSPIGIGFAKAAVAAATDASRPEMMTASTAASRPWRAACRIAVPAPGPGLGGCGVARWGCGLCWCRVRAARRHWAADRVSSSCRTLARYWLAYKAGSFRWSVKRPFVPLPFVVSGAMAGTWYEAGRRVL